MGKLIVTVMWMLSLATWLNCSLSVWGISPAHAAAACCTYRKVIPMERPANPHSSLQSIKHVHSATMGEGPCTQQRATGVLQATHSPKQPNAHKDADKNIHQLQREDQFRLQFAHEEEVNSTETGLLYLIQQQGDEQHPQAHDRVVVHYKGSLVDGKIFDSSYVHGQPATFALDQVIAGWREGLQLIGKGGKIKLVLPPHLAYGKQGTPTIPSNATLVFEVELLDILPSAAK